MTALVTMARSEFRLLGRDPGVYFILTLPVLLLTVFGLVPDLGSPNPDFGGARLIDFYAPTLLTMIIGLMSLNLLAGVLATYRERGVLRRLAVTPVRPLTLMLAQAAVNLLLLFAVTAVLLVVGTVAFDVPVPRQFAGFLLSFVLTIAAMFAIGLLIAALAPSGKAANGIGTVLFFPLAVLAGLWTPGPTMPDVLRTIGDFSPLGAGVQAMQRAWDGGFPQPLHLAVLLVFTLGVGFVAARLFRWE